MITSTTVAALKPEPPPRRQTALVVLALACAALLVLLMVTMPRDDTRMMADDPILFQDAVAGAGTAAPPAHLDRRGFLRMHKVVVFALFGDRQMDRDGALANAVAVPLYYPTWTPVFVVDDSIEEALRTALRATGATVAVMPANVTGAWGDARRIARYLVLADPAVQYAMFRDADSRVSAREIASVNSWLLSNRTFHLMRDHPNHTVHVLGGMWSVYAAGLRAKLGDVRANIVDYVNRATPPARGTDQDWLRDVIWPLIGDDVVDHDAFHCGEFGAHSRPWPLPRDYTAEYVGLVQDTSTTSAPLPGHINVWDEYRRHGQATFRSTAPERCRLQPEHIYA